MKTQVLVIGGGFAGVAAVQQLEKRGIQSILVDRKDYFEVTYAVLRDIAAPDKNSNRARKNYRDLLKGTFVQSSVDELQEKSAVLSNGNIIEFDIAVIASGSRYPSMPLAKSESAYSIDARNRELNQYHQQLKSASSVLVIGGGIVGVELAGEIADAMPSLDITLAHRGDALLDGFKAKAQKKAYKQLTDLGVNVEFNANYQPVSDGYLEQNSGKKSGADLVFTAVGTLPNNEFLLKNFAHTLNSQGLVDVDENLAVNGYDNLYALGDIAAVGEAKLGYLALQQGLYVAKTIAKQIAGKSTKHYKRNPFMALVPTGQKTGVVQLPFAVTSWKWLIGIKQKDMFISKTFRELSAE